MTTQRYAVVVIPVAYVTPGNLVMAIHNGDDPAVSASFSMGANPSGSFDDPATHRYCGMYVDEAWVNAVSTFATNLPDPSPNTWATWGISEADAIEASEHMHLQITVTQDGVPPSPQVTLNAALTALGIKIQQEEF